MKLQESGEMYLETILKIKSLKGNVKSIDVAEELNFSKPSVSRAVNLLKKNEYIAIDKNGNIELLDKGLEVAKRIFERHNLLAYYFELLGVTKKTAEVDACRIEHVISDETFNAIKNHCKTKK